MNKEQKEKKKQERKTSTQKVHVIINPDIGELGKGGMGRVYKGRVL